MTARTPRAMIVACLLPLTAGERRPVIEGDASSVQWLPLFSSSRNSTTTFQLSLRAIPLQRLHRSGVDRPLSALHRKNPALSKTFARLLATTVLIFDRLTVSTIIWYIT